MSDPPPARDEHEDAAADPHEGPEDEAIRGLVRRTLPEEVPGPDLVKGVQRRLRRRSRGKFFADGWSTTSSRLNYAGIAAIMLVLVALTYVVLGPVGPAPP